MFISSPAMFKKSEKSKSGPAVARFQQKILWLLSNITQMVQNARFMPQLLREESVRLCLQQQLLQRNHPELLLRLQHNRKIFSKMWVKFISIFPSCQYFFFDICINNLNVRYPDSINWLKITYFIIKIQLSMADEPSRGQLHAKLVITLTQKIEDDSAFNNMFKFLQSTINGAE